MTMTPERRQEIRTLHKMYSENLVIQPQHAVNVLVDCVRDLTVDNDALTAEIATLRTHLKAVVEAGEGANYQTPDTVGEYRYLLVYDSGDTWEDSGYCYSREAERIMNRHEAELQFSTRREDERPELYVLMPLKQHDALRSALEQAKGEK